MKIITLILLFSISIALGVKAQTQAKKVYKNNFPAYVIYNAKGKQVTFREMLKEIGKHDICLFGEYHDDPISHWLEKIVTLEMLKEKGKKLVLGGEMWESDEQLLMDEFILHGLVDKKGYVEAARKWPNFKDYKPLLGIALRNKLKFVCTNIPRRYANIIYKKGEHYLDSLPKQAYQYLPPMPIHFDLEQPAYKQMLSVFGPSDASHKPKRGGNPMMAYKGENLVKAQAIKDATMAHFILKNWKKGQFFMHYNGVYHSMHGQSIGYYLKYYNKDVDIITINVSRQNNNMKLDETNNTGDFNIVVNEDVTTTY